MPSIPSRRSSLGPNLFTRTTSESDCNPESVRLKTRFSFNPTTLMSLFKRPKSASPPLSPRRSTAPSPSPSLTPLVDDSEQAKEQAGSSVGDGTNLAKPGVARPGLKRGSSVPLPADKVSASGWTSGVCITEEPEPLDSPGESRLISSLSATTANDDEMYRTVTPASSHHALLDKLGPEQQGPDVSRRPQNETPVKAKSTCKPLTCRSLCASVSARSLARLDTNLHPNSKGTQSAPTTPQICQKVWLCTPPRPSAPTSPISPISNSPTDSLRSSTPTPLTTSPSVPLVRRRPIITRAISTGHLAHIDENGTVVCVSVHSDKILSKRVNPPACDQQRASAYAEYWNERRGNAKARLSTPTLLGEGGVQGQSLSRSTSRSKEWSRYIGAVSGVKSTNRLTRSQSAHIDVVQEAE